MKYWRNVLYITSVLMYFSFTISHAQVIWVPHLLGTGSGNHVHAADVDNDGDIDVLGATGTDYGGSAHWWENQGGNSFAHHYLSYFPSSALWVHAADLDLDSDMDILSAVWGNIGIVWFENDGAQNFTYHQIHACHASCVYAADIDNDGDLDILGAACYEDYFAWWENDGNQNFTRHIVGSSSGARCIYTCDIDGDSDLDIVGASYMDNLLWWENDGNQNFTEHIIDYGPGYAYYVYALDIDRDGDVDVITNGGGVTWWENDGTQNFARHVLNLGGGCVNIWVADADDDGDFDIFYPRCFPSYAQRLSWFENDGNMGFTEHFINESYTGPKAVYTKRLNTPGDMALLEATAVTFVWWGRILLDVDENDVSALNHDGLGITIFKGHLQLPRGKKCKVFDITGRAVEPSSIKPGIYFIEIDGVVTQKVVKVR